MARRVFSEDLSDLPLTPLPDWELVARIEQLFREHIPAWSRVRFAAMDRRGTYEETDLESFRREVEAQEELPRSIQLTATLTEPDGTQRFMNAWVSPTYLGSGGRVVSTDESVVHHVAQRLRELYAQAAARMPAPPPAVPGAKRPAAQAKNGRVRRFIYNPWTVTVGGGLAVVVILATLGAILVWLF